MFSVVSSISEPQHLETLREWFLSEWARVAPFEGPHAGFIVPAPLLAIDGQNLLGGLAFTSYPIPGSNDLGLWINTLLVAPAHRRRGIGSHLVMAAEAQACRINVKELFVYTTLPGLYQKLGWSELDTTDGKSMLKKVVAMT